MSRLAPKLAAPELTRALFARCGRGSCFGDLQQNHEFTLTSVLSQRERRFDAMVESASITPR